LHFPKDGEQAGLAVGWQFQGAGKRVNNPPEELFAGRPTSVAFGEFLEGDRFRAEGVSRPVRAEDEVVEVEELAANAVEAGRGSLGHEDLVVDEDIRVGQGFGVGMVAGAAAEEGSGSRATLVDWRVVAGLAKGQTGRCGRG
jgi:hypothetical protein